MILAGLPIARKHAASQTVMRHPGGIHGVARRALLWGVTLLLLGLFPGAARAEPAAMSLPGIVGVDDRRPIQPERWPWTALGRINRAGRGHCSGVLVSARHVLTAAHCLNMSHHDRWALPQELHFLAGYWGGDYVAHSAVSAIFVPEAYGRGDDERNLANDWAVLELKTPMDIAPLVVAPLPPTDPSRPATLSRAGYSQDRAHGLSVHGGCSIVGTVAGERLLLHDCDSTRGDSGSPLMLHHDDGVDIVGISVGVLGEEDGGWGVAVPARAFAESVATLIDRQRPVEEGLRPAPLEVHSLPSSAITRTDF